MNEIILCFKLEEQVIEDFNKIISLYHFEDIILCLYNPVYDTYTHITGNTIGKESAKRDFENNKCTYLYSFDFKRYCEKLNINYDLEKLIKGVKEKLINNPYLYINEHGSMTIVRENDLLKKAKDIFNRETNLNYFILLDYLNTDNAEETLKNNIKIIKNNASFREVNKFIDDELDRYNKYISKTKI